MNVSYDILNEGIAIVDEELSIEKKRSLGDTWGDKDENCANDTCVQCNSKVGGVSTFLQPAH